MSRPIPVQRSPAGQARGAPSHSPSLPSMLNSIMAAGSPADHHLFGFAHKLATPLDDDLSGPPPPVQRGFAPPPPPSAVPSHAPPPPPASASASAPPISAAAGDNLTPPPLLQPQPVTPNSTAPSSAEPTPSVSPAPSPAPAAAAAVVATPSTPPLSPKTSKLLRRIRRREDELEELSLENALLKEANRRANEERVVREQERRVEARRRAEEDAAHAARVAELEQRVRDLAPHEVDGVLHDPAECARAVAELRELLQLREEQLELINLDRYKLYEEIETWKVGMEKLASLQGSYPPSAFAQHDPSQAQPSPQSAAAPEPATPSEPAMVRAASDQKEDIESNRALSNSGMVPPPIAAMMAATNLSASPLAASSSVSSDAAALATPLLPSPLPAPAPAAAVPPESHSPVIEEIYENQHRHPFFGFQPTRFSFMRHPLSDESGAVSREFESVHLQPGWVWDSQWRIDRDEWIDQHAKDQLRSEQARAGKANDDAGDDDAADGSSTRSALDAKLARLRSSIGLGSKDAPKSTESGERVGTDADGWRYSIQFRLFAWHAEPGRLDTVRRRRWVRRRCWVGVEATEAMLQNALAAIQATQAAATASAAEPSESDSADPATAAAADAAHPVAVTLAELAAAYSSSDSGDSFSMFTSVAPPEVSGASEEGAGVRALAKLLRLGTGKASAPVSPNSTAATASTAGSATTSNSSGSGSDSASSAESSASSAPGVATPSAAPSSSSSLAAVPTALAQIGSYLASTRLSGWVGRKAAGDAAATSATPATPAASAAAASAASPLSSPCDSASPPLPPAAAPSPVCSYCTAASRTALQFVSPESSAVRPLCSYCLPHYRAALRHIVAEFHLSNPDPLPAAEIARRESRPAVLPHTLCGYCDVLDTYPVQLLHLAAPPTPPTESDPAAAPAAASESGGSDAALPSSVGAPSLPAAAVVLESHDAYRFCAAHLPAFLRLVQQFEPQPIADSTTVAEEAKDENEPKSPEHSASATAEDPVPEAEAAAEAEQTAEAPASDNAVADSVPADSQPAPASAAVEPVDGPADSPAAAAAPALP